MAACWTGCSYFSHFFSFFLCSFMFDMRHASHWVGTTGANGGSLTFTLLDPCPSCVTNHVIAFSCITLSVVTIVHFQVYRHMCCHMPSLPLVQVASTVQAMGLGWQPSFAILLIVYFYSHYFFASNVAHVSAMYSAFLAVMAAAGTPVMLAALVLAFVSNFMGAISTWGMSHGPMFFGHNFLPQSRWMALSLVVSVFNLTIWFTTGSVWWRFLGLW